MQPQPIMLYRRRATLVFQAPFSLVMTACLLYAGHFAVSTGNRLFAAIFWLGAFVTFCIAWTLGRAAQEGCRLQEPAVSFDASGIIDLRDENPQTMPWRSMQHVTLDALLGRHLDQAP